MIIKNALVVCLFLGMNFFGFCQISFPDKFPLTELNFKNKASVSEKYSFAKEELKAFLFFDIKTEPTAEIMYSGCEFLFEKTKLSIFPIYFSGELVKKRSPEFSKEIPTQLYRTLYKSDFNFFNFKEEDLPILVIYNQKNELCGFAKNVQQIPLISCTNEKVEPRYLTGKIIHVNQDKTLLPYAQLPIVVLNKATKDTIAKPSTNKYGDFAVRLESWQLDYEIHIKDEELSKDSLILTDVRGKRIVPFSFLNDGFKTDLLKSDLISLSDVNLNNEDLALGAVCLVNNNCNSFDVVGNVRYEENDTKIANNSKIMLTKLVEFLKKNPKYKLTINSHVSNNVDVTLSQTLTAKHAQLIADFMISQGIKKNRLAIVAIGNSQPRNRCLAGVECTDAEHNYNVRSEFKFSK